MADVAAEAALGGSHHILIPVTDPASAVIELPPVAARVAGVVLRSHGLSDAAADRWRS
jgi:hypothetical protein